MFELAQAGNNVVRTIEELVQEAHELTGAALQIVQVPHELVRTEHGT